MALSPPCCLCVKAAGRLTGAFTRGQLAASQTGYRELSRARHPEAQTADGHDPAPPDRSGTDGGPALWAAGWSRLCVSFGAAGYPVAHGPALDLERHRRLW